MGDLDSGWQGKGATLSDKTARREFGLTQDEIVRAIRAGKLHYRQNSIHGNPFLRLLRREVWRLTAVFCMRFVRGFDEQILEALDSRNPDIHYEAVCAAGAWEVDAAWPHIAALVTSGETDKPLLLAAIEAVASIRPREAAEILDDLTDSDD
jgi:hypothetical protein